MMQVSQALQDLATQLEAEDQIPVNLVNRPDFYSYSHQTGEPVLNADPQN